MSGEEEGSQNTTPQKFLVVGLITSEDFQKCRFALTKLNNSFPKEFDTPDIRPMFDVEWNEFITKQQRRLGSGLWSVKNCVAVFKDGDFLGDYSDLFDFIWMKRRFVINQDWYDLACKDLVQYLEAKTEHFRQLAYLTIAVDNKVIGTLLFQLYNDIVPLASENFLKRCSNEANGYLGAPIHRIVNNSWIQCGGYDLDPQKIPCENYVVPHDRRGVLSMCNNGPHKDNSTQFYITLDSSPWMNYKYVAFGQLLQGDDVLKAITEVPTYYQAPTSDITIVRCGEFKTRFQSGSSTILFQPDEITHWKHVQEQVIIQCGHLSVQHMGKFFITDFSENCIPNKSWCMFDNHIRCTWNGCKSNGVQDILTYIRTCHQMDAEDSSDMVCQYEPRLIPRRVSCDSILSKSKMENGVYCLKTDMESYKPFSHLPDFGSEQDEGDEDYGNFCEPTYALQYRKKHFDDNVSPASSDKTPI